MFSLVVAPLVYLDDDDDYDLRLWAEDEVSLLATYHSCSSCMVGNVEDEQDEESETATIYRQQ